MDQEVERHLVHSAAGERDVDLELLTPDQLCKLLQVRKSWLYDQVEAGRLPHVRLGKQLRFRRSAIAEYLQQIAS